MLKIVILSLTICVHLSWCTYDSIQLVKSQQMSREVELEGAATETFEGPGVLNCFGQMTVTLSKETGEGVAECRPVFEDPELGISMAPQGFIADGEDESHWVVVDDLGYADCQGSIYYNTGDHGLGYCTYVEGFQPQSTVKLSPKHVASLRSLSKFCGHFTCTGEIQLVCNMHVGCHCPDCI